MVVHIGAGGWSYFHVPGMDSLMAYARLFNFVEVNSTFYFYPSLGIVKSWRSRTPQGFRFAVRCHRDLTHSAQLQPIPEAFEAWDRMMHICQVLRADVLHLQTPPYMEVTDAKLTGFRRFFNRVDARHVRLAWEVRSSGGEALDPRLASLMKELGIVHCADISREEPAFDADIQYARLFGAGGGAPHNVYRFEDAELRKINEKVEKAGKSTSYLVFHSVRMYADAARLKAFRETGSFPELSERD